MSRRPRTDPPGSWHHVINRAVARRPLFEDRTDIRRFLAGVARAVRRREIELHAWCVMTTHFHLLVRSPHGALSTAMRRIQSEYVRHFNRSRRRDGPLVRGRFRAKRVDSLGYRRLLVRYIDNNPVHAGLCRSPAQYEWCSARQYATERGPRWLARDWVESLVMELSGLPRYDPRHYPDACDAHARHQLGELVAARIAHPHSADEFDSLLAMASPETLRWLRRKAALADGTFAGQPLIASCSVNQLIADLRARRGRWPLGRGRRTSDAWSVLHAGLLRDLSCASFGAIARQVEVPISTAGRLAARHRLLLASDRDYGRITADVVRQLITATSRLAENGKNGSGTVHPLRG